MIHGNDDRILEIAEQKRTIDGNSERLLRYPSSSESAIPQRSQISQRRVLLCSLQRRPYLLVIRLGPENLLCRNHGIVQGSPTDDPPDEIGQESGTQGA